MYCKFFFNVKSRLFPNLLPKLGNEKTKSLVGVNRGVRRGGVDVALLTLEAGRETAPFLSETACLRFLK